jgi:hypothetical protein
VRVIRGRLLLSADELDGVGDDLDGLAFGAILGLPLAPVEASVDGDAPALREVASGVLALDRSVPVGPSGVPRSRRHSKLSSAHRGPGIPRPDRLIAAPRKAAVDSW